jgi:hypothetical protein
MIQKHLEENLAKSGYKPDSIVEKKPHPLKKYNNNNNKFKN